MVSLQRRALQEDCITEHENILFAFLGSSLPSATEMGAAAPTPIRSASEKFIITRDIAIFTAANAPSN